MLVIGEKELEEGNVSVRKQGEGDQGIMSIEEFAHYVSNEVKNQLEV